MKVGHQETVSSRLALAAKPLSASPESQPRHAFIHGSLVFRIASAVPTCSGVSASLVGWVDARVCIESGDIQEIATSRQLKGA